MLHISPREQKERLAERLERPDKYWKYNPTDVDERAFWPQYQEAYQEAADPVLDDAAPWHVVPADRKWYARWAVQQLLLRALARDRPAVAAGDVSTSRPSRAGSRRPRTTSEDPGPRRWAPIRSGPVLTVA